MRANLLPRYCHASSSRLITPPQVLHVRHLSILPPARSEPAAFFTPPFRPHIGFTPNGYPVSYGMGNVKGKGKEPGPPKEEEEVDDREWEVRSARAMLHLRNTLPYFFDTDQSTSTLFPSDIFSQKMVLKLNHPVPLKISSLSGYSMAFALARNGMQALHSDLRTHLERMTHTQSPRDMLDAKSALLLSKKPIPAHRQKQIRVSVAVYGTVRLPPHHEAVWKTSSLYTLCPRTGKIMSHEVETIRPLPGEGVTEWLKSRLLGWTGHAKEEVPCPRAVPVPPDSELARIKSSVDTATQSRARRHYE